MDLSGSLGGLGALFNGPGTALVLAIGEEGDEAQEIIAALDQPVKTRLFHPQLREEHGPLLGVVQLGDVLLQLGADRQHLGSLLLGQSLDIVKIGVGIAVSEARLIHIGGVDNGLAAQEVGGGEQGGVILVAGEGAGGLAGVQMLRQGLEYLGLMEEFLVALGGLGRLIHAAIHHFQIGHDQLQIDGLNVAQGVHGDIGAGIGYHMHNVFIVKAADHMNNGVGAADVLQELITQTRALAGSLDQARDVHELNDRRGLFIRLIHLSQLIQPRIRHRHHAHIGLDGAEGVVSALGAGVGDGVKEGGLAYIGQADDT